MKKRQSLKEATLRNYLRREIQSILREAEEEEKTNQEPEEETKDESDVISDKTTEFIRKIKGMDLDVDSQEVEEMLSIIIDSWGFGSDTKLGILKGVKSRTIR